jgi:predicted lipoprotein with Yx(FWY)xxD motif
MNSPIHLSTKGLLAALAAALVIVLAACGDESNDSDSGSGSAAAGSTPNATVSVESVDGVGDVLVDSKGAALYTADQERDGRVRCTEDCADIWLPLTLTGGGEPSGSDQVPGELGVVERPGGERQVSYDGVPLYSFADDTTSGQVTGDGLSDTFGGELFSWDVVTVEGAAAETDQPASPSPGPY